MHRSIWLYISGLIQYKAGHGFNPTPAGLAYAA